MTKTVASLLNERIEKQRNYYNSAKEEYQKDSDALQNVINAIENAQKQQRVEQEKSQLLENDWRQRFRDSGGQMSDDLKSLHLQQVSHKELAKEYDGLVAALELDKGLAELVAAKSGLNYQNAHRSLMRSYASYELEKAMETAEPLIRGMALRLHALSLKSHDEQIYHHVNFTASDNQVVLQEVTQQLESRMESYRFDMKEEALLQEIRLYSESIKNVDQKLLTSPITRMKKGQALREQREKTK
ncbi:hypothetical protein AO825_14010 [Pectobacterium brasiliense]|uniref:hypothetical protein n=1 Tax=Pectobacterium brasiliense TaxID=180957 RepID=UPI0001A434AE|nr:hypothetical protein [Pectobacterium brasiliense]KGA25235.1 hypothetical protein KS44_00130 [Pectobacterium brasiliense]KRF61320.1 hypothetical protein AO825_14010 [Pectobacterium brasiliense]MBN3186360.1 hypothetical protein [Pectobacterium brasiliense]QHG27170.1 hypothetical protein GT391_03390 [Pectobacterium brasiliense]